MKHQGRGVIRIGDKTDHGGSVTSASSGTVVMGKEAVLADDMTYCPICKGQFAIKPDGQGAKHAGRPYAYHGDLTDCGARLLTSLEFGNSNYGSSHKNEDERAKKEVSPPAFDDRFVLLNEETGEPEKFIEYAVERESGEVEHGVTNDLGETHLISATTRSEKIIIYAAIDIN